MSELYIERYRPVTGGELADELVETGLLLQVNAALNPHGLALGVTRDTDGRVISLDLHEDSDPLGVWLDESTVSAFRRALDQMGLVRRRRRVAGRDESEPRGQASPYRDVHRRRDR